MNGQIERSAQYVGEHFNQYFTAFLSEWLPWAQSSPQQIDYAAYTGKFLLWPDFSSYYGLCENFYQWLKRRGEHDAITHFGWHRIINPKLCELFRNEGLDEDYPFGAVEFEDHCDTGVHHTHQPRLDWVEDYLSRNKPGRDKPMGTARHPHYNLIMLAINDPNLKFEWWSTAGECWKKFDNDETPEWDIDIQYRVAEGQVHTSTHPHADVLRRYAEDCTLVVEYYSPIWGKWIPMDAPSFNYDSQYRIAGDE